MGQQQLLLVILVTILVGIATVVAINTFGSAADNANVDAVRNDMLSIASAAQGYYMKPAMMGGGGQDFSGMTWGDISGVPVSMTNESGTAYGDGIAGNANGTYDLGAGSASSITVTGSPTSGGDITMIICEDDAAISDYAPDGGSTAPACPGTDPA